MSYIVISSLPELNLGCGEGSTVDVKAVSNISAKEVEFASIEEVIDSAWYKLFCSSDLVLHQIFSELALSSILFDKFN